MPASVQKNVLRSARSKTRQFRVVDKGNGPTLPVPAAELDVYVPAVRKKPLNLLALIAVVHGGFTTKKRTGSLGPAACLVYT